MQLDLDYKGFSFLRDGPLDMRMDPTNPITAATIVASASQQELERIFQEYGEEPRWKRAAQAIIEERKKRPIITTKHLSDLLESTLKTKIRGKLHPATLVFQALRIAVNREIEVLQEALDKVVSYLSPEGIVGVISFHSFEDRLVKNFFREAARKTKNGPAPVLNLITKKPLVPTYQEIRGNPRARSAKLRFAQKN
jgi:16S rRNA (cytosine1402-N4)-methyltransferase